MADKLIFLAAGGTGGHLFPAEALAHELKVRGYAVHLVTDRRAERFAGKFPADEIHVVPSATIGLKNPIALAKAAWTMWRGLTTARRILSKYRPAAIVGFGGYPTVPPLLSAVRFNIPTVIHEQNAVMGRANKALAARVKAIAGGFLPETGGAYSQKTVATGNPVRPAVIEASLEPYATSLAGEPFHLVVFGGSQGAQFFSQAIPAALNLLAPELRARLNVTQQARAEDKDGVIAAYRAMGVPAAVSPFFTDMAARIAAAQLVISRSGASTVSELSAIGRPSVLVPYPYALDHDQAANAAALAKTGGAEVIKQADLSPERLADIIASAMNEPARLASAAASAKLAGKPDAATDLADLVVTIAEGGTVEQFKTHRNNKGARP